MALAALLLVLVPAPLPVFGQEAGDGLRVRQTEPERAGKSQPRGEIFTGVLATKNSYISWGGMVQSLSGGLYDEGWRVRLLGAYGRYGFMTGGQANRAAPALFEIMAGYQFKPGPLISKLYLGVHGEHHKLDRPDRSNKMAGMHYGAKIVSENWLDLPGRSFASLDLSFSTVNKGYLGLLRTGSAKLIERLSVGPEMQIVGNEKFYQLRFGGFVRWKFGSSQLEANAGYSRDYDQKGSPYFGASWLKKY